MNLDPKVIIIFFINNFFGTVYIFPIWFISVSVFEKTWTKNIGILTQPMIILLLYGAGFVFFSLLILGCYLWSWLTFINFSYELAQDGLHMQSGIFIRKRFVIPYNDIDTVDLLINPFVVRLLNLYAIQIKTREIKNTEGIFRKKRLQIIPGLHSDVARSLKSKLQQYSHVQTVRKTFFDPVSGVYK
jgi:uncharacterized membrane protein YdbT with pleckstrin-like domain